MKTKRASATNSDQKTSIRRSVRCPNCHWLFVTEKDEPQCSKCGVRFYQA